MAESEQPIVVKISYFPSTGAMSVEGPTHDKAWTLAALEHAVDAVRNSLRPRGEIVIPGRDMSLKSEPGTLVKP